jgi:hypothetical protein
MELILHKALIKSIKIYACPAWEFAAEIATPAEKCSPHQCKFSKAHTDS